MRSALLGLAVVAISGLTACGDRLQSMGGSRSDVAPYQGVDNKFAAPGWKAGDKTNWEQALKTRALYGQNEYSRAGVSK
jgi:outer membrane lipopolysaccharide assembly protein LptE/RlpB